MGDRDVKLAELEVTAKQWTDYGKHVLLCADVDSTGALDGWRWEIPVSAEDHSRVPIGERLVVTWVPR